MKKIYLALMCMAGFTLMTACGGKSENKGGEAANGEESTEQKADDKAEAGADLSAMAKFDKTLNATYGISMTDLAPSFSYAEKNAKGGDLFYGEENGSKAVAHFMKADGTDVTQEEFNEFATKLYNLTKGISQDGKNVKGFVSGETLDEALQEVPIEKCIGKNEYDVDIIWTNWEFRKGDTFYRVDLSKGSRGDDPEYIDFTIDKSLQKSLSESMQDADKAMEQLGY